MFHLVTGGSASGKSSFAEQQILNFGEDENRIYIATMIPGSDPENARRIEKHRKRREDMNFRTIECYTGLLHADVPKGSTVLLDCMSNLVANEMFTSDLGGIHTIEAVLLGMDHLISTAKNVVVVTNEIFSSGVEYGQTTRIYMQFLGSINQELARWADQVTEVVYGIPVTIKKVGP